MNTWVGRIIIVNAVMLVATMALPGLQTLLMFVPAHILFKPWTLVTYMFLHAGFGHLIFNMLTLYFFGPRLEEALGARRFLTLYGVSGVMAAVLSFLLAPNAAIVGASGAIYGVLMGFAMLWPRAPIHIWGVLPIEARWLILGWTILSIMGGLGSGSDGIAHFAHLGGFVGGYLYITTALGRRRAPESRAGGERKPEPTAAELQKWKGIDAENLHVVNREEYRRIMEKLEKEGAGSLSPTERDFLNRFAA